MSKLGKLEKVDLRDVWKHEAQDFTNWLAKPENIRILSDEIGIDIEVLSTEKNVGKFSCDILGREENSDYKIVIENQLESTDHDHLGKIITYASGLDAKFIIWICKDVREEHRHAVDWLNEISDESFNFFAVKLELWRIGDSEIAPKFNIVCSPNNWAKAVRQSKTNRELSDTNLIQLDFWGGYSNYIVEKKKPFRPRKPSAQHWYDLSIGTSQAHIANVISVKDNFIRVDLYIHNNKDLYKFLFEQKNEIENEIQLELDWQELPNAKASRVAYQKEVDNISDDSNDHYEWLYDNSVLFHKGFAKRIKSYRENGNI